MRDTTEVARSLVGEDIQDRNLLYLVSIVPEVPTIPANVKIVEDIMVGYAIRLLEPVITVEAWDTLPRTAPVVRSAVPVTSVVRTARMLRTTLQYE